MQLVRCRSTENPTPPPQCAALSIIPPVYSVIDPTSGPPPPYPDVPATPPGGPRSRIRALFKCMFGFAHRARWNRRRGAQF
ncbi:hypothetical protein MVEN_00276800 [Mycena venus]|uniref:Uncharacterized protein n=1 Tax=Mycena venus TaxID=2733690 RepID=A0A8H6Z417_9AGAR|nr:hypothetical protein MVEN_00276800 [Mycena venus]